MLTTTFSSHLLFAEHIFFIIQLYMKITGVGLPGRKTRAELSTKLLIEI